MFAADTIATGAPMGPIMSSTLSTASPAHVEQALPILSRAALHQTRRRRPLVRVRWRSSSQNRPRQGMAAEMMTEALEGVGNLLTAAPAATACLLFLLVLLAAGRWCGLRDVGAPSRVSCRCGNVTVSPCLATLEHAPHRPMRTLIASHLDPRPAPHPASGRIPRVHASLPHWLLLP
jgi:hypothetical protein